MTRERQVSNKGQLVSQLPHGRVKLNPTGSLGKWDKGTSQNSLAKGEGAGIFIAECLVDTGAEC